MLARLPRFSSRSFLFSGFRKVDLLHFSDCKIHSGSLSRSLNYNSARGSVPHLPSFPHLKFARNARPLSTAGTPANPDKSIQDETTKALHTILRKELKKETQHEPKSHTPFKDWAALPADRFLGGDKSTILLSRHLNDEEICIVTSTEVLQNNLDDHEEEEEGSVEPVDAAEENGFGSSINSLMLIAITKPSQKEPLYFECILDRYGFEVTRVHVGMGFAGFMSDPTGPSPLLYHVFISYREQMRAEVAEQEGGVAATSPEFSALDPDLQALFLKMLEERGVDDALCAWIVDELARLSDGKYVRFLSKTEQWLVK